MSGSSCENRQVLCLSDDAYYIFCIYIFINVSSDGFSKLNTKCSRSITGIFIHSSFVIVLLMFEINCHCTTSDLKFRPHNGAPVMHDVCNLRVSFWLSRAFHSLVSGRIDRWTERMQLCGLLDRGPHNNFTSKIKCLIHRHHR